MLKKTLEPRSEGSSESPAPLWESGSGSLHPPSSASRPAAASWHRPNWFPAETEDWVRTFSTRCNTDSDSARRVAERLRSPTLATWAFRSRFSTSRFRFSPRAVVREASLEFSRASRSLSLCKAAASSDSFLVFLKTTQTAVSPECSSVRNETVVWMKRRWNQNHSCFPLTGHWGPGEGSLVPAVLWVHHEGFSSEIMELQIAFNVSGIVTSLNSFL